MTINRLNQGTTNQVLVKAISGQTTNLLELQDSSGNVVSSIGPTGALGGTVADPYAGAWTTFTPTWTNLTVGNGTYGYAKYKQIGKTVFFAISFVFGSTTSVSGNPLSLTLPFDRFSTSFTGNFMGNCIDAGVANYPCTINMSTINASLILIRPINASGTYAIASEVTSTIPFTWGTNDRLEISGIYEGV
jgi:hypothetical protein